MKNSVFFRIPNWVKGGTNVVVTREPYFKKTYPKDGINQTIYHNVYEPEDGSSFTINFRKFNDKLPFTLHKIQSLN